MLIRVLTGNIRPCFSRRPDEPSTALHHQLANRDHWHHKEIGVDRGPAIIAPGHTPDSDHRPARPTPFPHRPRPAPPDLRRLRPVLLRLSLTVHAGASDACCLWRRHAGGEQEANVSTKCIRPVPWSLRSGWSTAQSALIRQCGRRASPGGCRGGRYAGPSPRSCAARQTAGSGGPHRHGAATPPDRQGRVRR